MDMLMVGFVVGAATVSVLFFRRLWKRGGAGAGGARVTVHAALEDLRSLGELLVFKVVTREIVTIGFKDEEPAPIQADFPGTSAAAGSRRVS